MPDCLFDFPLPLAAASRDDDLELGAPGLVLEAEAGLSGKDVFKFGGPSSENPGICEGEGLDFIDGEFPRDCTGFFACAERSLDADEDREAGAETAFALDGVEDLRVGVDDLRVVLGAAKEGLEVGVEARAVALLPVGVDDLTGGAVALVPVGVDDLTGGAVALVPVGVDDLTGGATGLAEDTVARDVGVEDLEYLVVEGNAGLPDGVTDLEVTEVVLLLLAVLEKLRPGTDAA